MHWRYLIHWIHLFSCVVFHSVLYSCYTGHSFFVGKIIIIMIIINSDIIFGTFHLKPTECGEVRERSCLLHKTGFPFFSAWPIQTSLLTAWLVRIIVLMWWQANCSDIEALLPLMNFCLNLIIVITASTLPPIPPQTKKTLKHLTFRSDRERYSHFFSWRKKNMHTSPSSNSFLT